MLLKSNLKSFDCKNQRVFLRADLNVPLSHGKIVSDFRLLKILDTLDYLLKQNTRVILATHIDRPHECEQELSTQNLVGWFESRGYKIIFEADLERAYELSKNMAAGTILLLENMRFYPGEKSDDQACRKNFVQALRKLADLYVDDAFADLHRKDASIFDLPKLFEKDRKTIGFLVEQELQVLEKLRDNPERPFVLILGGGKVKDKLPLITSLLDNVDTILLGPATVFTFMGALNQQIGVSLVEPELFEQAREILVWAQQKNINILFPADYWVIENTRKDVSGPHTSFDKLRMSGSKISLENSNKPIGESKKNFSNPLALSWSKWASGESKLKLIKAEEFTPEMLGVTIGPKTLELWAKEIDRASTVFLNGAMGFEDKSETMRSFEILLQTVANATCISVIGGGESVAAVYLLGLQKTISFCSTGGGATLSFLSNKPLLGLEALK